MFPYRFSSGSHCHLLVYLLNSVSDMIDSLYPIACAYHVRPLLAIVDSVGYRLL